MKVRCISNTGVDLPERYLDEMAGYTAATVFEIKKTIEYVVYALAVRRSGVWYYVVDNSGVGYPIWHPAPLFELVDTRVSRYWRLGFVQEGPLEESSIFAFTEWADSPLEFYDRLSDGDAEAVAHFSRAKGLIDAEAEKT